MKKTLILLAFICIPLGLAAQGSFDSFENEKDVTSVVVTKNMFKLLSKMDLNSEDPEVKDYLNMVDNLDNIKIFTTDNPEVAARMSSKVSSYVLANSGLSELMRVKDDGKNIKFYSREGATENLVSELLMHLDSTVEGEVRVGEGRGLLLKTVLASKYTAHKNRTGSTALHGARRSPRMHGRVKSRPATTPPEHLCGTASGDTAADHS